MSLFSVFKCGVKDCFEGGYEFGAICLIFNYCYFILFGAFASYNLSAGINTCRLLVTEAGEIIVVYIDQDNNK